MSSPETASYRIAVDCMGGDKGPAEVVAAVRARPLRGLEFLETNWCWWAVDGDGPPLLVGPDFAGSPRIELRHAAEVIEPTDKPMQAVKSKKDASMIRAFELLKAGEVDAVVSTGNTKVLVGAGLLKLRTVAGAERPSLATIWPRRRGHFIMLDAGANPESTPEQLVHNAVLGSLYASATLGVGKAAHRPAHRRHRGGEGRRSYQ